MNLIYTFRTTPVGNLPLTVNLSNVNYFEAEKFGTRIFFGDGNSLVIVMPYEEFLHIIAKTFP